MQALPVSRQLQNRESKTDPGDRSGYPRRTSAFREWRRIQDPENGAERAVCATRRNSEQETRLVGCGCSHIPTSLSLQFGEMQGDFRKMQGGARRNLAKSHQISIVWMASPYSSEQGRSRETIFV